MTKTKKKKAFTWSIWKVEEWDFACRRAGNRSSKLSI